MTMKQKDSAVRRLATFVVEDGVTGAKAGVTSCGMTKPATHRRRHHAARPAGQVSTCRPSSCPS